MTELKAMGSLNLQMAVEGGHVSGCKYRVVSTGTSELTECYHLAGWELCILLLLLLLLLAPRISLMVGVSHVGFDLDTEDAS